MPTYLKSYVVVMAGILLIMIFAKRYLADIFGADGWWRRFGVLIAITSASFLARDFWLFCLIAMLVLIWAARTENNSAALYALLLLAVPPLERSVGGFAGINHIISINFLKILALGLCLPAYMHWRRTASIHETKWRSSDYWIVGYFLFKLVLYFPYNNATGIAREVLDFLLEIWWPYLLLSRTLNSAEKMRQVMGGMLLAAMIASVLGAIEGAKHWAFFVNVRDALNVPEWYTLAMERGNGFRAQGASGQPIVLGTFLATAAAFYLYLQRFVNPVAARWGIWVILTVGMASTLSRGPWVGYFVTVLVYAIIAPGRGRRFAALSVFALAVGIFLGITPYGDAVIKYVPFMGDGVEDGTVDYRTQLFNTGMQILSHYPLFGTPYYMNYMEHLRQGQGIIDLVNTYLVVALPTGAVGLLVWLVPPLLCLRNIFGICRSPAQTSRDEILRKFTGGALLAALLGYMVTIATVSPINLMVNVMYVLLALGVAFTRLEEYAEGRLMPAPTNKVKY